jgi:hypothetical protein
MACRSIDAGPYNDQVRRTGSKAAVNFRVAMDLLEEVWRRWPAEHPRLVLDRHGGRVHYAQELEAALPGARVTVVGETPTLSRYVLEREGSRLTLSFGPSPDRRVRPGCPALPGRHRGRGSASRGAAAPARPPDLGRADGTAAPPGAARLLTRPLPGID